MNVNRGKLLNGIISFLIVGMYLYTKSLNFSYTANFVEWNNTYCIT